MVSIWVWFQQAFFSRGLHHHKSCIDIYCLCVYPFVTMDSLYPIKHIKPKQPNRQSVSVVDNPNPNAI
ncbi:unnamed protein product [Cuscuta campestris]|uniref:Uncharacterized protein n=1 Tax=Cuscuta campestris TaxID=132261 RepID=A0A484N6M1_9ASTE|nr:unnamed protein product [Cuscuta campestris]